MPRNTLGDLNNHLFESIERLNNDALTGEKLREEIERARAVTGIAEQVIANGNLALRAKLAVTDAGRGTPRALPAMLEG